MRLTIAEKPELAKAIVEAMGGGVRKNGYYECGNDYVTYCFGHMLRLLEPHEYDEKYAKWNIDHLPLVFIPWKHVPSDSSKEQLEIIIKLLEQSESCIHAGDPDPEGQLLVDEVLDFVGYSKPVQRVLINDNNVESVREALSSMTDNQLYIHESNSTLARSICDQLYGFNMSRLYTLVAQRMGYQGTLPVGRVVTPIMGLVVRRDLENASHVKKQYYDVEGVFNFGTTNISAKYQVNEHDPIDEKKRIIDNVFAEEIKRTCQTSDARIRTVTTKQKKSSPPLPYNILKLQADASRKFGLSPAQTKDITQALREKHKLITYNRSDCQYLKMVNHEKAPSVLSAIAATAPQLAAAINASDTSLVSRAFNDEKVSAHHGIIPTTAQADLTKLSEQERKIYLLIARCYIAQFFPSYCYDQTIIEIECKNHVFLCRSNVPVSLGWKALYKNDVNNEEVSKDDSDSKIDYSHLTEGERGSCSEVVIEAKETKPQPHYTMDTLLTDLTRVAKYIKDPDLRNMLIERDKEKEGEHGGIGTPATRDTIIESLFERDFLEYEGKKIRSTKAAQEFYSAIPDEAKFPDMTAIWHQRQLLIESGELDHISFIKELVSYIEQQVKTVTREGLKGINVKVWGCPTCGKAMRRLKGEKGFFWGCTAIEEGCRTTLPDRDGVPVLRNPESLKPSDKYKCTKCGAGLVRRAGSKRKPFWGCSNYPDCKSTYQDMKGRPNFKIKKVG